MADIIVLIWMLLCWYEGIELKKKKNRSRTIIENPLKWFWNNASNFACWDLSFQTTVSGKRKNKTKQRTCLHVVTISRRSLNNTSWCTITLQYVQCPITIGTTNKISTARWKKKKTCRHPISRRNCRAILHEAPLRRYRSTHCAAALLHNKLLRYMTQLYRNSWTTGWVKWS